MGHRAAAPTTMWQTEGVTSSHNSRALGAVAVAVRTGYCEPEELEAMRPDFLLDDFFNNILK